jgi:hypothetical protein
VFGFVRVTCETGTKLLLSTDGAIHDTGDVRIGRHELTLWTAVSRVRGSVNRRIPVMRGRECAAEAPPA